MLFLPIGHDQTIRRFPWVTVAVMVLCTLLQMHRTFLGPSMRDAGELALELEDKERAVLERVVVTSMVPDGDPTLVDDVAKRPQEVLARVRAGKLGDPRDPAILALKDVDARIEASRRRDLAMRWGYRPTDGASVNLILAAFVHGGWMHLAGNLLFLWLCGCNLEDRWGRGVFAGFYLATALVASLAYGLWHRGSDVPMVGASGAIAGGMGAFLICYHSANIKYWWWWWFRHGTVYLRAYIAFPVWFLSQLAQSFFEAQGMQGVAYSAHVGGFVFGVLFALAVRVSGVEAKVLLPATAEGVEWSEDPDFVQAMEIAPRDPAGAIVLLRRVLERDFKRDDVRLELCRLAAATNDAALVDATATRTFLSLGEQARWGDVVELHAAIDACALAKPLSDRAYSVVVRAAIETGDPKLCVRAATKLQSAHPESPLMPRALWDVAAAQKRAGRDDLAQKTLRRLIESYPTHAFAAEAKRQLGV